MRIEKEGKTYLDTDEALQYLVKKWDIPSYSRNAFHVHCMRNEIKPDLPVGTSGFWTFESLDNIPRPKARGRPSERSKKQHEEEKSEDAA